jgi:uncharacterized membrane protein
VSWDTSPRGLFASRPVALPSTTISAWPTVPPGQASRRDALVERTGWSLGALLVVFWGLRLWTGSLVVSWMNVAAVAIVLAGLALAVWIWVARHPPGLATQLVVIVLLAAGLLLWGYLQAILEPSYGTDELAFGQYAAELVRSGANPYTHSMQPAFERFLVPAIYHTYLLDGSPLTRFSYPALGFLLDVPALVLGVRMQAAVFTDLVFWAVAFVLLWRLLPRRLAWVAGLLMSFTTYANFVAGGVNDALFMPFVFLALWRWDRFGDRAEPGFARWLGPVALGFAMAVKQTPWFLLPFLLVGVAHEARARGAGMLRQPLRYAGLAAGTFAAVNAPFLLAGPAAWARGVLTPLLSDTVPSGQGLINLALFEQVGGLLAYQKLLALLACGVALLAFALHYPRLKRALVALVALVFFWPHRSFASYLIDLAPAALLAATTVRPAVRLASPFPRLRTAASLAAATAFGVALALTLTARPPLRLAIVGVHSTGQQGSISGIDVSATNTSDRPLRPRFAVAKGGYLTSFWYPLAHEGATTSTLLPPHATRRFFLRAPNVDSMPALRGGFVLEGFTSRPAAVTASRLVPPSRWRLVLSPDAVDRPVPVGSPVSVEIKLVDRLGNAVDRAGVPVSLAQVSYAERGLLPGLASIDGRPEGESPVTALTDAAGVARFVVRGVQAQSDPVFFQAWIEARGAPPHGYSNLLSIQFVDGSRS